MHGQPTSLAGLALMMLELQGRGAHNVNLVTSTHFIPQWLAALELAATAGLRIPIVFNSSGYEKVETLRLLEGVVDIWLPDAKYADDTVAHSVSGFRGYVATNRQALLEIQRQVGNQLLLDDAGLLRRGMIIRHLVLPADLSDTAAVFRWIVGRMGTDMHVSLMNQYFPAYRALTHPILHRRLSESEYDEAIDRVRALGFERGWVQEGELALDANGLDDVGECFDLGKDLA
jgi:putative pyruvate formate lyase activating enzyme